jgi:hypothetical protein
LLANPLGSPVRDVTQIPQKKMVKQDIARRFSHQAFSALA